MDLTKEEKCMALRFMRYDDASVLRKKAIPIKEITAG